MDKETTQQIVNFLIVVAIPGLATYLGPLIKEYFRARIEAIRHEQLRAWVWDFVQAAEQAAEDTFTNADKRLYVLVQLKKVAQSFGVVLTDDQAEALLEAAVYTLKQQRPPAPLTLGPLASVVTGVVAPKQVD